MAQLKSLLVNGPTRLIGDLFANNIQITTLNAPTSAGGTTYGPGANGKVLKSNGSSVYWADDNNTTYTLSGLGGIGTVSASGTSPLTLSASKSGTAVTITGSVAAATTSTAGLMSAADKVKLNGITESADAVSFTRSLTSGTKIGTITINGSGTDLYCQTNTNTTYTFANGTNGFTVTPSGGTAQTVTVTPSITNNITGSGASGYLTKFNGTNTITNGPALGSSTTTFLRNDGTWTTPPVTSVAGKTGAVALGTLTIGGKTYNGSSNTTIEIADLGLASTTTFLGITSTNLSDGSTTNPITVTIGPTTGSVTASNGSVVMEQDSGEEFIWTGSKWNLMGLASSWALANHIHGNILNNGAIIKEGIELQSGDQLLFANYDNSGKIEKTAITFDGSTTNEFLSRKGTWQAAPNASTSQKGIVQLVDSVSSTATNMAATARAVNEAYGAVAGKVNKSGDTMTGPLTVKVLKGTNGIDYGGVLPATATEGQIFFQTSAPHYELPAGGAAGAVLIKNSNDNRDVKWHTLNFDSSYVRKTGDTMTGNLAINNPNIESSLTVQNSAGTVYLYSQTSNTGNRGIYGVNSSGTGQSMFTWSQDGAIYAGGSLYGAVWNDYAEFRKDNLIQKHLQEPGRCVREVGDGTLILTDGRLQRGCEIISDTFGFAIGQDKENGYDTPIASSGRVLAYCYEGREIAKNFIGWPVCSGPNGTISIMSEEEENRYPSRIIGTISEIPDYEEWGSGKVKVNGRIWIRIK